MTGSKSTEVVDLVAALRATVEAAKRRREEAEKPQIRPLDGCSCDDNPDSDPCPSCDYGTPECDWGYCNREAVAERLAGPKDGARVPNLWLPVCAEHARSAS